MGLVTCSNCAQLIGNLEARYDFNGATVCVVCYHRLKKPTLELEPVVSLDPPPLPLDQLPGVNEHACASCGRIYLRADLVESFSGLMCEACRTPSPAEKTGPHPIGTFKPIIPAKPEPQKWKPVLAINALFVLGVMWLVTSGRAGKWFGPAPEKVAVTKTRPPEVTEDMADIDRLMRDSNRLAGVRDYAHAATRLNEARDLILSRLAPQARGLLPEVEASLADYTQLARMARQGLPRPVEVASDTSVGATPSSAKAPGNTTVAPPSTQPQLPANVPPTADHPAVAAASEPPVDANDPEASNAAGWSLVSQMPFTADVHFAAALSRQPGNRNARIGRACCAMQDPSPAVREAALRTLEEIHAQSPDRLSAINLAAAQFEINPARSGKVLREHLVHHQPVDETALNYLGTALARCDRDGITSPLLDEYARSYVDLDRKLELSHGDGKKRWGETWIDAVQADQLWDAFRTAQAHLAAAVADRSSSANQVQRAEDQLNDAQRAIRRPMDVPSFQSAVSSARSSQARAESNYAAALAEVHRVKSPPWPETIPYTGPAAIGPIQNASN